MQVTGDLAKGLQADPYTTNKYIVLDVDWGDTVGKLKQKICEAFPDERVQPDNINISGGMNNLDDTTILRTAGYGGQTNWSGFVITKRVADHDGGYNRIKRKSKKRKSKKSRSKTRRRKSKKRKSKKRRSKTCRRKSFKNNNI